MTIGTQIPVAWSPGRLPSRWWRLIISVFFFHLRTKSVCRFTSTETKVPGDSNIHGSPHNCESSEENWRHYRPNDALHLEVVPRFLANYLTPNTTIGKIWVGKYLGEVGRVSVCYYVGVCLHGVSTTTKNFTVVFAVEMLTDKPPNKILPLY